MAAAAESTLQQRLAEAESDAIAWRETAWQELEARQVRCGLPCCYACMLDIAFSRKHY